jgi:hypothetical protein
MNFLLAIYIWPISRLLTRVDLAGVHVVGAPAALREALAQEGENGANIPLQEKFRRRILRGLRNISDTP